MVGAPAYFARHGRPSHPREVLNHPCIRHRFPSGASYAWEFEKGGEVIRVQPDGPLITGSVELELAAAEAGVGLLATFEGFAAEAVAAGRLERVLEDLAGAVQRAVSLLSQPPPHARATAGVRGLREGGAGRALMGTHTRPAAPANLQSPCSECASPFFFFFFFFFFFGRFPVKSSPNALR